MSSAPSALPPAQQLELQLFRLAERLIGSVRRVAVPALDRLHLEVRARCLALDPATLQWVEETKRAIADGSIEEDPLTADEVLRLIEERRKLT